MNSLDLELDYRSLTAVDVEDTSADGDGSETSFTLKTSNALIVPKTLQIDLSTSETAFGADYILEDTGTDGTLSVRAGTASNQNNSTGSVNYVTGDVTANFESAPANNNNILLKYSYYSDVPGDHYEIGESLLNVLYENGDYEVNNLLILRSFDLKTWNTVHFSDDVAAYNIIDVGRLSSGYLKILYNFTSDVATALSSDFPLQVIGTGDGTETSFSADLLAKPNKGSMNVLVGDAVVAYDNNRGAFHNLEQSDATVSLLGSSSIDYAVGRVSLEFSGAVASGVEVKVQYRPTIARLPKLVGRLLTMPG